MPVISESISYPPPEPSPARGDTSGEEGSCEYQRHGSGTPVESGASPANAQFPANVQK